MYKKTLGAIALTSGLAFGLAPSASAAEVPCGAPAVDAVYKTITHPAETVETWRPEVTDEVKVIDVVGVPAIPATPGTPAVPAVAEVSHIEKRLVTAAYDETVVVKEAWTEVVPGKWYNWSPNKDRASRKYVPTFTAADDAYGKWSAAHTKGGPGQDQVGVFHQGKGNGSYFYREAATTIDHPAKTRVKHHKAVYEDVKVIDVPAKDAIPAVPGTPEVPAVEEVSHFETIILEPAHIEVKVIPAYTTEELVSEATPAGEPCPVDKPDVPVTHVYKPVVDPVKVPAKVAVQTVAKSPAPVVASPTELAYTGSETAPLSLLAGGLVLLGAVAYRLRRVLDRA